MYVAEYDRRFSEKGKSNNVYEFKVGTLKKV